MKSSYKYDLSNLTGSSGPKGTANWPELMSMEGSPYNLNAAPLVFSPKGSYITASQGSVAGQSISNMPPSSLSLTFGNYRPSSINSRRAFYGKSRKSRRKSHKRRKSRRKSRKSRRKSRKSRRKRHRKS